MRNKIIILGCLLSCILCFSQQEVTWKQLSDIKFTDKYFPKYDDTFLQPNFSKSVKSLEGKRITVKGYFLNIGAEEKVYILSKGPMASCYFCGQGGPETAIELEFDKKPNFKIDAIVSITGILELNDVDVLHFNYILKNCKGELLKQ